MTMKIERDFQTIHSGPITCVLCTAKTAEQYGIDRTLAAPGLTLLYQVASITVA